MSDSFLNFLIIKKGIGLRQSRDYNYKILSYLRQYEDTKENLEKYYIYYLTEVCAKLS